ncbi:glutathione-disulfide reductase [Govanella unica]|uniref:Glutathione reductase n=1 Tax=Govanella unica TaxID=2975056 RepID=A0A9X3TXZ2_9PROT|nr:glutathione-disulfide reductase [Govania unica]
MEQYDLFVIGAGSGGVRASRMASAMGARVGICEDYRVGGTCVIRGCVPKKLMVYAAEYRDAFRDAQGFGWGSTTPGFDWAAFIANKDKEIDRLNGLYLQTLGNAGVTLHNGRGRLLDRHTVEITGHDGMETIRADKILIATGGWPVMPSVPGIEHAISSNEVFHLPELPGRVAVVGGGYIAVEFAGIFHGLGARTTQLYRGEQILRGFDREARDWTAQEMLKKGLDLRVNINVEAIEKKQDGLHLALNDGTVLVVDAVMYATGRNPNTAGLGLEDAGVKLATNGAVVVDDYSRSSAENIYAVGDVTDRIALTPVAIKEGAAVAETLFGRGPQTVDYRDVPSAVFGQPQLASVGLTEEDARHTYQEIDVYKSTFRPMKFTLAGREERSLMKLIVDRASDRVLGAHMVGPDAAEIIQGVAIAIKCGATKAQFDVTVAIHPSAAEEFVLMREPVKQAKAAE